MEASSGLIFPGFFCCFLLGVWLALPKNLLKSIFNLASPGHLKPVILKDAVSLLTVGSFLLTVELFLLAVDNFSFFTYNWSFFAYCFGFFTYSWSFFAYSGKVHLIRALGTVSKEA